MSKTYDFGDFALETHDNGNITFRVGAARDPDYAFTSYPNDPNIPTCHIRVRHLPFRV